ncbi:MAG: hypothetical protein GF308_12555 [Candidatus Heimdallarchaeota archaeon]|nr:hypothetical protein [Candidatus Heimdallarchaeota archaeon]
MTYVPPEKKSGSSNFGDIVYIIIFYLIEGLFIFIGVPFLVFAIAYLPASLYFAITGNATMWPLYIMGAFIAFFQILAIQAFMKRYVLEPHGKTFGEWLRWKFSPKEIKKRREERRRESEKMDKWYAGMERIKETEERIKTEQSYDVRSEWFAESGDPDSVAEKGMTEEGIVIVAEDAITTDHSEVTSMELEKAVKESTYTFQDSESIIIEEKASADQEEIEEEK